MPLSQRIGLHVSAAGGVEKAPDRAQTEFTAECFQFFSRSPRGGGAPPLSDEQVKVFREQSTKHNLSSYIHTPYFINFSSQNKRIYHGSISVVREELERGSRLGVEYIVTHLGSAREWLVAGKEGTSTPPAALDQSIKGLKEVFRANPRFSSQLLLEIAAGAGSIVGDTFEELAYLLKGLGRRDVHVCLDTCHLFAAGYDIRDKKGWNDVLKQFEQTIGLSHLKLVHVNDSKVDLNGRADRHEHLGHGKIGKDGFKAMLAHPALQNVSFILETKHDSLIHKDILFLKQHRKQQP